MYMLISDLMDQDPVIYLFDDLSQEELETLRLAHGNAIGTHVDNEDIQDALNKVNSATADPEYAMNKEWAGRWVDNQVQDTDDGVLDNPVEIKQIFMVSVMW